MKRKLFTGIAAVLADMLNNRPEFKSVEYADGELNAVIADEYCDEAIGEESGMSM